MSGSHVLVHSLNSIGSRHLAVLLVHVVGSGAGVVSDPDTKVLDLQWTLLVDLEKILAPAFVLQCQNTYDVDADDLSVRLLDLSELHQEVPETRLCNHGVGRKDSHSVQLGSWVGICRQMAANDLVFRKTTCIFESASFSNSDASVVQEQYRRRSCSYIVFVTSPKKTLVGL